MIAPFITMMSTTNYNTRSVTSKQEEIRTFQAGIAVGHPLPDEDLKLINPHASVVTPDWKGFARHYQLRDLLVHSSIGMVHNFDGSVPAYRGFQASLEAILTHFTLQDPNYIYCSCYFGSSMFPAFACVNLQTGVVAQMSTGTHFVNRLYCLATGFGYVAAIDFGSIYVFKESDWTHIWHCQANLLNSVTITKLLPEEGESEERIVVLAGSNGGCLTVCEIPKEAPEDGKVGVLPIVQQLKTISLSETSRELLNINCIAHGKGRYTDYLIGAPDKAKGLYIFLRQYPCNPPDDMELSEEVLQQQSVSFELIEQLQHPESIILPLIYPAEGFQFKLPANSQPEQIPRNDEFDRLPDSLNLAWSTWFDPCVLAAGTDSGDLFLYDFDVVYELLQNHPPEHVFTLDESKKAVVYWKKSKKAVRLMKFSPIPSVPLLAFADMGNHLWILDCTTFEEEYLELPDEICGMSWALDASHIIISTCQGIFKLQIKKMPSLVDTILLKHPCSKFKDLQQNNDGLTDRHDTITFGKMYGISFDQGSFNARVKHSHEL